ncbi:hypothetical protein B296_00028356 [Ensete ventricosum]|uniref:Uncharacterized protein n=1 Tax=Ensete ventricosum TaxID=4639 RepID=A0A426YEB8_ENSVE|nr:hypothetical protein B296_00028356 [Ensete ventricosum]
MRSMQQQENREKEKAAGKVVGAHGFVNAGKMQRLYDACDMVFSSGRTGLPTPRQLGWLQGILGFGVLDTPDDLRVAGAPYLGPELLIDLDSC